LSKYVIIELKKAEQTKLKKRGLIK